jgi:hypothetical protein
MMHLGLADWPGLERADDEELEQILSECQRWEAEEDPSGVECPRAKRHHDKTIAVTTFSRPDHQFANGLEPRETLAVELTIRSLAWPALGTAG